MYRDFIKNISYLFFYPVPFRILRKVTAQNFIFPFYHLVSNSSPLHIKHNYPVVSVDQFISDLDFLLKYYNPASINDVLAFIQGNKNSIKPFFYLTFDDGLRECFDIVYPILKEKGIEAAFFVNTGFIDNKDLFYKFKISLIIDVLIETNESKVLSEVCKKLKVEPCDRDLLIKQIKKLEFSDSDLLDIIGQKLGINFQEYLARQKPYMTIEQLKLLNEDVYLIGSHTHGHPLFSNISEHEMQEQVKLAHGIINEEFNPQITTFAFPFTDFNVPSVFFKFLNSTLKMDVTFGTAGLKKDSEPKNIQRIPMEVLNKSARRIIRTEYSYYWMKSLVGKNIIKR